MVSIHPRVSQTTNVSSPYKTVSRYSSYDSEGSVIIDINSQHHDNTSRRPEMSEVTRSTNRPHRHRDRIIHETSSSSEGLTHHESSHRRRRRRRRRPSEIEIPYTPKSSLDHHERHESPRSRKPSVPSLPIERRHRSTSEKVLVEQPLETESRQRVQSRRIHTSRSTRQEPETQMIEEVSESDSEHHPRTRRSRSIHERNTRPNLVRSSTSVRYGTNTSSLAAVKEETRSQRPRLPQRSHSVWGSLLGPSRLAVPEAKVSCLTCMDDVPISKAPKLSCGHRICSSCLKRIFTLSVSDPAHMPPKCCTEDCIPLKHVVKIFDDRFKMKWNRRYKEYTTKNRIYCPAKGCASWIPPKDIARDRDGRKYGTCRKCKTQVCAACNCKRHKSKECPKDAETQQFAEMMKDNGWQSCYNCSATVELKEGCNHMTCRCTAQFCMICGSKWKSCDCPWFNFTSRFGNAMNDMNIHQVREEMARDGAAAFAQPLAYQEELDQRREQERQDEAFARRLEGLDLGFGVPAWDPWRPLVGQRPTMINRPSPWFNDQPMVSPNHRFQGGNPGNPFRGVSPPLPVPQQQLESPRLDNPAEIPRLVPSRRESIIDLPTPVRRSATTSIRPPRKAVQPPDSEDEEGTESNQRKAKSRRSAMLAGLNRASDKGRVDAWRKHVYGEPVVSPM